jgi:hypothetical protein
MSARESVPTTWTSADDTFFRIVAHLLPPSFVMGAGVLLASYDDEPAVTTPAATAGSAPVTPRRTAADTVAVRVRRTS